MSNLMEICPRCEEGILVRAEVPYEIEVSGSPVRIPRVQVEECRACDFRSLSGRETRLFELLFAPQYEALGDLVAALRTAGYLGMFLREDRQTSVLAFGARHYVAQLDDGVRDFYLDNESNHVIEGLYKIGQGWTPIELASGRYTVRLPRLGEGECGIVYDYQEDETCVLKLAKPRPYSREHLREECELTAVFDQAGVPVPRILDHDPHGSYLVKTRLVGEGLSKIYPTLGPANSPRHLMVRASVEAFLDKLMNLFVQKPASKTSVSPNNIFVTMTDGRCDCLLVDAGPAPFHDYSQFRFDEYWNVTIPKKIEQYRTVGYL